MYQDAPRNNPDKTYYPGDTFYYVIMFTAGPSCVSFHSGPVTSSNGISLNHGSGRSPEDISVGDDDPYVDSDSIDSLKELVSQMCDRAGQYTSCIYGKATIQSHPDCDGCITNDHSIRQSAYALKRICTDDGCRTIKIARTATITPDILGPDLQPVLTLETIRDSDTYDARNLDGTYYVWDPITALHVPELQWKNNRSNTIHFEVSRDTELSKANYIRCLFDFCDMSLEHPGTTASQWELGNGDDVSIYNATSAQQIGLHDIIYAVDAYNNDVLLDSAQVSIHPLVVSYIPLYAEYPYSVLADDQRTSYENRAGIALHYFGSLGNGIDDIPGLHEDRRSKINDFYYLGLAYDPWDPVMLNDTLGWSEAPHVGILDEEHQSVDSGHNVIQSSHNMTIPCKEKAPETAMLVRAGYCRIYFDYPILDGIIGAQGPQLENVTLYSTLISENFAGFDTKYLSHSEYVFSESLFHTEFTVESVEPNGTRNDIPISIFVAVPEGVQSLPDYLYEKVYHDTSDLGLGEIISGDSHSISENGTGAGEVSVKLRRVSSEFETYRPEGWRNLDGLDIVDLAPAYLENSHNARLAVPLHVGLGALAPVSVSVEANNITRQFEYDYVEFKTEYGIQINAVDTNALDFSRHEGSLHIRPTPNFGDISVLHVDGNPVDIDCDAGCIINTPSVYPMVIEAQNIWGGRAHANVPEFVTSRDPLAQHVATGSLAIIVPFLLSLPILYWTYHRIKR